MRGFTSAFIILATATACGSQYDAKQPVFARGQASQETSETETLGSAESPIYVASSADLSKDVMVMSSQDLDAMSEAMGQGSDSPAARAYTAYSPAPDVQAKLDSCNLNWNSLSGLSDSSVQIRDYNFNVTRLQRSRLMITGSGAEIVFVNIAAERRIGRVDIALTNPKATYCLNISAGRVINRLQITHACQAKLGVVNIEAGVRARNVSISGNCL